MQHSSIHMSHKSLLASVLLGLSAVALSAPAMADNKCEYVEAVAGPMFPGNDPELKSQTRAAEKARTRGREIRAALVANGLTVGQPAYSEHRVACRKAGAFGLRRKCRARVRVCVYFSQVVCPSGQYYSLAARACTTLR